MKKFKYDTKLYPFKNELEKVFGNISLEMIKEDVEVFSREKDQSTKYHRLYYEWAHTPEFEQLYRQFIIDNIKPLYVGYIVYQAIPTFRIAYPNNIAVGEFHKDKNYRDPNWAKDVEEYNFFLPFTNAWGTNTIWVESEEDKGDFNPMNCDYGEFIQWDGSNLTHGNKINETGKTRVSVDFRVIDYTYYKPSDFGSINTGTKFKIGEYYKLI